MKISDTHCSLGSSLNTPVIPAAEQAEAYLAWKRGEIVDYWGKSEWWPLSLGVSLARETIIRRKPTPALRPWTGDEVPLGAWMRAKMQIKEGAESGFVTTITSKSSKCLWLAQADMGIAFVEVLRDWEYSDDRGSTWSACGVVQ